jgi:hypothetical protein
VVILGVILLVLGLVFGLGLLITLGVILAVLGVVLWFVPLGGSTHRYY